MVDFRYHVVSIVAVFLALALGIVIGTYTINGQVLKNIRHQVSTLRHENDGLRGRVQNLEGDNRQAGALVKALSPLVVGGQLARQRVVVIAAPGAAQGVINDVKNDVIAAGGTISSTVKLDKSWIDPKQNAIIGDLAGRLAEPGLNLPVGSAYERAARVLATALLRHPPVGSSNGPGSLTSGDLTALSGFATAGLVTVSPVRPTPGTLAVFVVGGAPAQPTNETKASATTITDMMREFDTAGGGLVVAGAASAADAGGVIALLRSDASIRKTVSSVDDTDTDAGRIRLVFALAAELDNSSGQYGTAPGATAPLPSPASSTTP